MSLRWVGVAACPCPHGIDMETGNSPETGRAQNTVSCGLAVLVLPSNKLSASIPEHVARKQLGFPNTCERQGSAPLLYTWGNWGTAELAMLQCFELGLL